MPLPGTPGRNVPRASPGDRPPAAKVGSVSAFQEHFLDKYFGYRRRYVDAVAAIVPQRRSLAVASEIARLSFATFASALCAAILWTLFAGALARAGGIGVWPVVFGLLAVMPTGFGALAVRGIATAIAERRRPRR
jgi:hypothetical protein